MLEHAKSAAILILLITAVFMRGQVSTLTSSLEKTTKTLSDVTDQLEVSLEEIAEQNAKIEEMRTAADSEAAEAVERVRVVYRDLPSRIQQDHQSPADAESMNQWLRDIF